MVAYARGKHAFELACAAREAAEKSFGYHPNHGRVL